jgi:hypothetical protein
MIISLNEKYFRIFLTVNWPALCVPYHNLMAGFNARILVPDGTGSSARGLFVLTHRRRVDREVCLISSLSELREQDIFALTSDGLHVNKVTAKVSASSEFCSQ